MNTNTEQASSLSSYAVELVRQAALSCCHMHTYLPQSRSEADKWHPHAWVVSALTSALRGGAVDPSDPWRGLYSPERMPKLDGCNQYHAAHPDLPSWPKDEDEERGIAPLINAQGFALNVAYDEYPEVEAGEEVDCCAWLANWTPKAPAGENWRLVCICDTEDGPAAFYVRPLALINDQAVGNG